MTPAIDAGPFQRSIGAILKLALRNTGADGVFLYWFNEQARRLSLLQSDGRFDERVTQADIDLPAAAATWLGNLHAPAMVKGSSIFPEAALYGFGGFAVVPAVSAPGANVLLTAGWVADPGHPDLSYAAALALGLSQIVGRVNQAEEVQRLMMEVARRQSELADWKIAERATGLLESGNFADSILQQHIARVLEGTSETPALIQRLSLLEAELQAREVIAGAKAILQRTEAMNEQQAYLYLQRMSRRTRRALEDVARDITSNEQPRSSFA